MDALKREILDVVSSLSEEDLKDVIQELRSLGVKDKEDLKLLKEKDLIGAITPVQWRKLLAQCVLASRSNRQPSDSKSGHERLDMRQEASRRGDAGKTRRHGSYETDTSSSSSSQNIGEDFAIEAELLQHWPAGTTATSRDDANLSGTYELPDRFVTRSSVDSWSGSGRERGSHNYLNLEDWCFQDKIGSELQYQLVKKLLETERVYVGRLNTIYHEFYCVLQLEHTNSPFLEDDTLSLIFSNVKSIYLLHKDSMLPQLEETFTNWKTDPRLGEMMKRNAPFLKIYGEYIANFTSSMEHIDEWMEKSTRFHEIIRRLEQLPQCEHLLLQDFMMEPVKRLIRYKSVMTDYVGSLPPSPMELQDAQDALSQISKATSNADESLTKIEIFKELLDIYYKLRGVPQDFITPTRHFVMGGPIAEISSKSGEILIRHLFLFNDSILVCTDNRLTGTFNVWKILDMDKITMKPCDIVHFPNAFELRNNQGACILLDQNLTGVPLAWEKKIEATLNVYKQKLKERQASAQDMGHSFDENDVSYSKLGQAPPVLVTDPNVTKCMICDETFSLVKRKQNCMACGKLICKSCSKKYKLDYNQGKIDTVCAGCFDALTRSTTADEVFLKDIGSSTFYSDA
ncbi:unnamed protein product [Lymnaea stagnalis]|uniref:Uncharacterized protein n=1 Tax=Lymnaea stagnalis TaxID=6523 RepID=A0AAV2H0Y5_LYMST